MFDPERVRTLCHMPEGSTPIALPCVRHVAAFHPEPMLQTDRWDSRSIGDILYENARGPRAPSEESTA